MQNRVDSKPLVSIGVPVYNGEKYLNECLRSILNQTYPHWECFIINNQSTDQSLVIAEEFQSLDSRMKVITNPTFVDMTSNFNNTIKFISPDARYFKVVCADDWLFPEYLEKMTGLMEMHPNTGFCSSYRLDNKQIRGQGLNFYDGPVFSGKEILYHQLLNDYDVTGSETTVLYRIDALKKTREYPVIFSYNSYHFDTSLAYELLSFSEIGFVFQILSYTRRHQETYTSKYVDRFRTSLNFREKELHKYKQLMPGLEQEYRIVRANYGNFLLWRIVKGDKECIDWHKKHLDKNRYYNLREYLHSFVKVFIRDLIRKLKKMI